MRLALALGAALVALTATAAAQPEPGARVFIRHHGGSEGRDANNDGWVSRDEAQASADRLFDELDRNDDGRLNDDDHQGDGDHVMHFRLHPGAPGSAAPLAMHGNNCERTEEGSGDDQRITIICRGDSQAAGGAWVARIDQDDDNCTREESGSGNNRRVTVTCTREEHESHESNDDGERRVDRTIIVRRGDHNGDAHGHAAPEAPTPPMPPHPPMFMMMMGDREEFDRNGDGALSREEFRAQQLAFFNASDGNGDGRIRAVRPPEPPQPPQPPAPPTPPRR